MNNINYPDIYNNDIKVLGRVVSIASENKVAAAEQIFDEKFKYIDLGTYSYDNDNIDPTKKGMDQYSINRLLGKKMKSLEDAGIMPDEDNKLHGLHIVGLTVEGDSSFDNIETEFLNVTNRANINKLIVGGTNVGDFIDRINKIVDGTTKDNALWNAITTLQNKANSLESRVAVLEACCEDIHNNPQGGVTITANPDPINLEVGQGATNTSVTVSATSSPALAGNWTMSSADTSIASVSGKTVTAVSKGRTSVTITWGTVTKTIVVNVVDVTPSEPTKWTVTFDPGMAGLQSSTTLVNDGAAVTRPVDPQKEGYTFNYWKLDGQLYDFNSRVTSNITLVGDWTLNTTPVQDEYVTVTFDPNGGTSVDSQTIVKGGYAQRPENPTRRGYNFLEWVVGTESGPTFHFEDEPVNNNITLVARWETIAQEVTVTFDPDNGQPTWTVNTYAGSNIAEPTVPTKNEYNFVGWFIGDSNVQWQFSDPVNNSFTLKAHWSQVPVYTINWTCTYNGGDAAGFCNINSQTSGSQSVTEGGSWTGTVLTAYAAGTTITDNGIEIAKGQAEIIRDDNGNEIRRTYPIELSNIHENHNIVLTTIDDRVQVTYQGANIQAWISNGNNQSWMNVPATAVQNYGVDNYYKIGQNITGEIKPIDNYEITNVTFSYAGAAADNAYYEDTPSNSANKYVYITNIKSNVTVNVTTRYIGQELTGPNSISVEDATINVGETAQLVVTPTPADSQYTITSAVSGNTDVCTTSLSSNVVSVYGVAHSSVPVLITVTTSNGLSATCHVTVNGSLEIVEHPVYVVFDGVATAVPADTDYQSHNATFRYTYTGTQTYNPDTINEGQVEENPNGWDTVVSGSLRPDNNYYIESFTAKSGSINGENVNISRADNNFTVAYVNNALYFTWVANEIPQTNTITVNVVGDNIKVYNGSAWKNPDQVTFEPNEGDSLTIPLKIVNTFNPDTMSNTNYRITDMQYVWQGANADYTVMGGPNTEELVNIGATDTIVISNIKSSGTITITTGEGSGNNGQYYVTYTDTNPSHTQGYAYVSTSSPSDNITGRRIDYQSSQAVEGTIPGTPHVGYVWAAENHSIANNGITFENGVQGSVERAGTFNGSDYYKVTVQIPSNAPSVDTYYNVYVTVN